MRMLLLTLLAVMILQTGKSRAMATQHTISTVVRMGDVAYYLHPLQLPQGTSFLSSEHGGGQFAEPCTVLTVADGATLDAQQILATFQAFQRLDDVWSEDFAHSVIIQVSDTHHHLSEKTLKVLKGRGVHNVRLLQVSSEFLPQGPYFIHHGHLYESYRLYPDTSGAFIVSVVPAENRSSFRSLDVTAYGEQHPSALTVAVPSRLYYSRSPEKPYAGLRIAVKDIIDLKGLKTGASSRAYTDLYPVKTKNADVVQKMIDLGFIIVGKLKTTQFADSEWPTCDWVDYHGPFNPRGDGYLTPSGSSAGSAAAIASYDWLDFSLGSDTLGSIRSPSAAQGIFGMRPSLGAVSTKGVVPYSPHWDTLGGFARTAGEFRTLAQALYGDESRKHRPFKNPTKLLYPTDYWPVEDEASQKVFEKFIAGVESFLDLKRTEISLADTWLSSRPEGINETLSEYFSQVFEWSANPDQWTGLLRPFLDDYLEKFGKRPVLNPQIGFKMGYLPTITQNQQAEGLERLAIYHDWFYENVLPSSVDGYSSTILVLPWTDGKPNYRNTYKTGPQEFTGAGFFFYNVGPYAQCPELIFPVGSTPYQSKHTHREEQLPAALGIIGAKGSDMMLADFVSKLFEGERQEFGGYPGKYEVPISPMEEL